MAERASVEIVVNAVSQAAESALESVGDELRNLAVSAYPAQAGLDETADELDDVTTSGAAAGSSMSGASASASTLASVMWLLSGRVDEAGDEMTETAAETGLMGTVFSSAAVSAGGLTVGTRALSTSLTSVLIPALVLLSTTLVPLVTILGGAAAAATGLALAFAAIVGTGLVAYQQQLQAQGRGLMDVLNELKTELAEIAARFGQDFVPLLQDAIQALPQLLRNVLQAIGPLDQFAQLLREWGRIGMTAIPGLVGALVDLARMALPAVRDFVSFLQDNGPAIFRAMRQTIRELAPYLRVFIDELIRTAPVALEFGTTLLKVLLPALSDLVAAFRQFMQVMNAIPLAGWQALFVALGLAIALVGGPIWAVVGAAIALSNAFELLRGGWNALTEAIKGFVTWLGEVWAWLQDVIPPLRDLANLLARVSGFEGFGGGGAAAVGGSGLSRLERRRQLRNTPEQERNRRLEGELRMDRGEMRVLVREVNRSRDRDQERSINRSGVGQ